jgi:hypothetical protein
MNGDNKTIAGVPVEKIQERATEHRLAIAQANSTPLPGPLRDVFAIVPEIAVGQFKVRPLCDYDFEILQAIDHPIYKMSFGGQEYGNNPSDLRGKSAWQICYMLTRSVDEVEKSMASGTAEFDLAAKQLFSRLKMAELVALMKAVFQQVNIFWSPVIGYEETPPEPDGDQADGAKKNAPEGVQTC